MWRAARDALRAFEESMPCENAPYKEASTTNPNLNFHKKGLFPSYVEVLSFNTWCLQMPGWNGPKAT